MIAGLISAGVEASTTATRRPSVKPTTMQFGRGASIGAGIVGTFLSTSAAHALHR